MKFRQYPLIAVLLLIVFTSASCMKKQKLDEEDLGPTISSMDVASALGEGFGPINYNDIRPNEKVGIAVSQTLQGQSSQIILQQDMTITGIDNGVTNANKLVLNFDVELTAGTQKDSATGLTKSYTKEQGFAFADDDDDPFIFLFEILQNVALGTCYDGGTHPETCHNLVATDVTIGIPATLAPQHSHCVGQPTCAISGKRVEFDLVRHWQLESDGRPKRIHYSFLLSNEVPFTSRVMRYCTRSLYSIEGQPQKVLADICYAVNNYTFGTP